jgi:NADH-quinone oxidoreductase subunit C
LSPEGAIAEETEAPPEPDVEREQLLATLAESLGEGLVESHLIPGLDLWVRVTPQAWTTACTVVRDRLDLRHFDFLSAIDWMPSPYGKGEDDPTEEPKELDTEVVQGYAGGETRFQVIARMAGTGNHLAVNLKVDIGDDMTLPTIVGVYAGADWHERETWEMFGIFFDGHPGLKHIYLPGDFEGHPLRKDFPLIARMVKPWPGIVDVEPMPPQLEEEPAASDAPADDDAGVQDPPGDAAESATGEPSVTGESSANSEGDDA